MQARQRLKDSTFIPRIRAFEVSQNVHECQRSEVMGEGPRRAQCCRWLAAHYSLMLVGRVSSFFVLTRGGTLQTFSSLSLPTREA